MLEKLRIVMVNPSHPGNIGAAARAMRTMGLKSLYLVSPKKFPHQKATVRAAGADDILQRAVVVEGLLDAVKDCELVFGTSARGRSLPWPISTPRECAKILADNPQCQTAILFGRERTGLTNQELAYCHYHVYIPTTLDYSSLNLAAAIQVITYELRMAHLNASIIKKEKQETLATVEELVGLYEHMQQTMIRVGYLDQNHPKLLMQRMQRLFNRAQLKSTEINIIRGFLSAIDKYK